MTTFLERLARHRKATLAAVMLYFVAVVLTHGMVQRLAYSIQRTVGRETWSPAVLAAFVLAGVALTFGIERRLRGAGVAPLRRRAWYGSLAATATAGWFLLATNMELVHLVQYALLAVGVLALTRRLGLAVLCVTALGAFDEWWQYAILHPRWPVYYDWNDVVLNALGAGLGCAFVLVCGAPRAVHGDDDAGSARARWTPLVATIATLLVTGLALHAAGILTTHRPVRDEPGIIELSRARRPEPRWHRTKQGRRFFVLDSLLGLAAVTAVAGAFTALDGRVRALPGHSRASTS